MKIIKFKTTLIDLPLSKPIATAIHRINSVGCVLLELETDQGIVGESYVFTLNGVRLKVLHEMVLSFADQVEGRDPHSIGEIWQNLWSALNPIGHKGFSIMALSLIDTACWDAIGKAAEQPLHRLFGAYHKNGYANYDSSAKALEEFTGAIELDPQFARARAWIVCTQASMWAPKSEKNINEALDAARFALTLDEKESETHRILGSLYLYARNYELCGHHFDQANRQSPNDAHIAVKTGRYYAYIDEPEKTLATVEPAMRLNPLYPGWYWMGLGIIFYSMW